MAHGIFDLIKNKSKISRCSSENLMPLNLILKNVKVKLGNSRSLDLPGLALSLSGPLHSRNVLMIDWLVSVRFTLAYSR